jgi:hypothetical protein
MVNRYRILYLVPNAGTFLDMLYEVFALYGFSSTELGNKVLVQKQISLANCSEIARRANVYWSPYIPVSEKPDFGYVRRRLQKPGNCSLLTRARESLTKSSLDLPLPAVASFRESLYFHAPPTIPTAR